MKLFNYTIRKNGYAIGSARGIRKAIDRIKIEIAGREGIWTGIVGVLPRCKADNDIYTVEKI